MQLWPARVGAICRGRGLLGRGRGFGPAFQAFIVSLRAASVVFVDEIHSLKALAMESLQIGMEGGVVAWNRVAPPFTLIGATTKFGKLPDTLRDRFGLVLHLHYYSDEETAEIASRSAEKLDMELQPKAATEIGIRSRGVTMASLSMCLCGGRVAG